MILEYITEDGHELDQEDFESYATWQIKELKKKSYSNDEILHFDDQEIWYKFTSKRLT